GAQPTIPSSRLLLRQPTYGELIELRRARELELPFHVLAVRVYGLGAHVQRLGDLARTIPLPDEPEHLHLALTQFRDLVLAVLIFVGDGPRKHIPHVLADVDTPGQHAPDGVRESLDGFLLVHEPLSAGLENALQIIGCVVHGDDQHRQGGPSATNLLDEVDAALSIQHEIDEDQIRQLGFEKLKCFRGILRFAGHAQIFLSVEQPTHTMPNDRVIVDNHNARFLGHNLIHQTYELDCCSSCSAGVDNSQTTRVPCVLRRATTSVPPIVCARYFIVRSPSPELCGSIVSGSPIPSSATERTVRPFLVASDTSIMDGFAWRTALFTASCA